MDFKKRVETFMVTLCLSLTGLSLMATSAGQYDYGDYDFAVSSDCVSPIVDGQEIRSSSGTVTSPDGVSFTDFGFPNADIYFYLDNQGTVDGANRNCKKTYGEDGAEGTVLFTCYDEGEPVCSILLDRF